MKPTRLGLADFRLAAGLVLGLSLAAQGCYEPIEDGSGESASSATTTSSGDGDGDGTTGDGDGEGTTTTTGDGDPPPRAPGGYYVLGNAIYDGDDQVHVFRGLDRPSLEWDPTGEGIGQSDVQLMASWNANVVRIAINQGFWLEGSSVYSPGYRDLVDQMVAWVEAAGMDVILDLHWSDRGDFSVVPAQQRMADVNSRTFWESVASRYKDDGRVFFELYNEPHDVAWFVWLNGGDSGDGYEVVGMQELYDTVRGVGADNLVLVGGLNYAYELDGVPTHRVEGYNIVYVSHPYDFPGKQPSNWEADWGFLAETDPIFVTEFGSFDCNPSYSQQLIDYSEQRACRGPRGPGTQAAAASLRSSKTGPGPPPRPAKCEDGPRGQLTDGERTHANQDPFRTVRYFHAPRRLHRRRRPR